MDKYDEYKYFGERVLHHSQRRQNSGQIYLAINTAIFSSMALLTKDSGFNGWGLILINLPLFTVGVLACLIWITIISRFRKLIGWQYEQLREMEKKLNGSYKFYTKEWVEFSNPDKEKQYSNFSRLESLMPKIFIGLYLVYASGMTIFVILGLL